MTKTVKGLSNTPQPAPSASAIDMNDKDVLNFVQGSNLNSSVNFGDSHRGAPKKDVKRNISRITYLNKEEDALLKEFCESRSLTIAQAIRMLVVSQLKDATDTDI